ncbi:MAG: hypothetical protein EXR79_05755 [Myxococcales bacterium]|nr:hypothetical protein [Myxococcales bacterium]
MGKRFGWMVAVAAGLYSASASAAEPPVVAVQGLLRSAGGGPVADGAYAVGVSLYDAAQGGSAVYEETFLSVDVAGGLFDLVLGEKKTKLADNLFDAPRWVGVTVTGSPELPRVRLHEVPAAVRARTAALALGLQCSGCVGKDALADGAVTAAKLATGSVQVQHVAFGFAASDEKGGSALHAKLADAAKLAETAKVAETAKLADVAKVADSAAKADDAVVASKALSLQCTGCVSAAMLGATVAADLVTAKQLAAVAVSGKYADLAGGPDLSGYGALAKDNPWTGKQTFDQAALAGAMDFAQHEAKLFRFHLADKDPVPCDATTLGLAYYDKAALGLRICNGKSFALSNASGGTGTATNPALACKLVLEQDPSAQDGLYWIDPDASGAATPVQMWCDMKGGGWTLVAKVDLAHADNVDEPLTWFTAENNTARLVTPKMENKAGQGSWGAARFLPYLKANTLSRFTFHAEGDAKQTVTYFKHAAPAAFAKWFAGDNTPTAVCIDEAMTKSCDSGVIAQSGDGSTDLVGMSMSKVGYTGGVWHMRMNGDSSPSYSALCSGSGDADGNKWNDGYQSHWGNGMTVWLR